jgi:hypothetical protein
MTAESRRHPCRGEARERSGLPITIVRLGEEQAHADAGEACAEVFESNRIHRDFLESFDREGI